MLTLFLTLSLYVTTFKAERGGHVFLSGNFLCFCNEIILLCLHLCHLYPVRASNQYIGINHPLHPFLFLQSLKDFRTLQTTLIVNIKSLI